MCVRPIWWNSGGVLVLCNGWRTGLEATLQASQPRVKTLLIFSSSEVCLGETFYLHTRKFSVLRFCNTCNRDNSWTKIVNTLPLTFLILKWTHIPAYPRLVWRTLRMKRRYKSKKHCLERAAHFKKCLSCLGLTIVAAWLI